MAGVEILGTALGPLPWYYYLIDISLGLSLIVLIFLAIIAHELLHEYGFWILTVTTMVFLAVYIFLGHCERVEHPDFIVTVNETVSISDFCDHYILINHPDNSKLYTVRERKIND